MSTHATATDEAEGPAVDDAPARPRRRLTAAARKASILDAARQAFIETGDATGTTIRVIAEHGGISEGVIYRHFESKDQLFYEAVVEPLRAAVDALVAATDEIGHDEAISDARRRAAMQALYRRLTAALEEMLPLLGLVLFGDPATAQRFYQQDLAPAMDRLGRAWVAAGERHGVPVESAATAARAVTGMALMAALEARHHPGADRDAMVAALSIGTLDGFFPADRRAPAGRKAP